MKKQSTANSIPEEELNQDLRQENAGIEQEQQLADAEKAEASQEAKLEVELSAANDKYLRLYSEFENYKKRVSRDRVEWSKMAGVDMLLAFLPVIDDMERALKAMKEDGNSSSVLEGLTLIYNKIKTVAEGKGLKAMESVGKSFDPDLHDAITNVPAGDENMKGKIIDEIEKGYYLNDKVIRHAKVIVGN